MTEKRYFKEKLKKMLKEDVVLCFILIFLGLVSSEGFELGRGAPIQMDVGAAKHITICTGLKRFISCRDGSNVAITWAFWGRTSDKVCPSDDGDPVTDCESADETEGLVKTKCEGKDQCQLEARHQYLQKNGTHHCPGVNKYLRVNYTCIPESKGVVLCDSEETNLECRAGWKIIVTDAFWGRRASAKYCGTAENAMECSSQDYVLKYLKKLCDATSTCKIRAGEDVLDDKRYTSCPGLLKYLMVNYACRRIDGPVGNVDSKAFTNDDENEATAENKLLADTSSKELMGLLEKHLNELQTTKVVKGKPEAAKIESDSSKAAQGRKNQQSAAKQSRHTIKPLNGGKPDVPEATNIPSPYLSGNAFVRTIDNHKELTTETESPALDIKETESSKKSQETVPIPVNAMASINHELPKTNDDTVMIRHEMPKASADTVIKHEPVKVSDDITVRHELPKMSDDIAIKHELPKASDDIAIKHEVPKASDDIAIKHEVPKANDDALEESFEIPEPATVKSILARAKEVLKSLDEDSVATSIKKSGISRKEAVDQTERAVKQVAKLAQRLVKTANRNKGLKKLQSHSKHNNNSQYSQIQQEQPQLVIKPVTSQLITQQRREKKPEPGPKKTGKSATGLGSAGVGNTP